MFTSANDACRHLRLLAEEVISGGVDMRRGGACLPESGVG